MGTTNGEGSNQFDTDTEGLKRGEQTGLETPVVHALNYEYSMSGLMSQCSS